MLTPPFRHWSPRRRSYESETERELVGSEPRSRYETAQVEDDIDREERDLDRRIVQAPALAYDPEPQRQWIVQDVIPDETLTLLTGEGGIGKTTLALQLAVAMRTDGDWLGMKVAQGPVLFVTSEDDRKDVNLNLRAILKAERKSLAHCPDLHILPLADRDACLAAASTKLGAIAATPLWHALVRVVERLKPRDRDIRRAGRPVRRRRKHPATRARIHRAAQAIGDPAEARRHPDRPSVAHRNEHRQRPFRLDRLAQRPTRSPLFRAAEGKEGKTFDIDLRTLTVKKVQYAQEGTVFRLRRKAGFFVYEGRDGGSTFDRAATAAKAETSSHALAGVRRTGPERVAQPEQQLRARVFEREADADGVSKPALARAMSKLLKANRIHIETVGPPSKQRKKLTPGPAPTTNPTNESEQ